MAGSFTDLGKFLDYRAPDQFGLLETIAIQSSDKLCDVASGLNNIAKEQLLTPHTAAGSPG